jgi:hypothetical protein
VQIAPAHARLSARRDDGQAEGSRGVGQPAIICNKGTQVRPEFKGRRKVDRVECPEARRANTAGALHNRWLDGQNDHPDPEVAVCSPIDQASHQERSRDLDRANHARDIAPVALEVPLERRRLSLPDDELDQRRRIEVPGRRG